MNQTAHQESLILLLKTAVLPHQHALQAWDSWKEKFGAQCKSAVETRFAPVIARRFAEWGFRDGWHSLLQDAARQAQLRNQLMFSTAVPIISRLQHLAISCLLLKGWGLIAAGIAETGYRYLGDIDI
ncbi:MAG TPA: hypothetical protein PLP17_10935, partial [Oligoflexia bacterium]|nr:hypothetical protein [Oligoflexia bacterium]